MHLLPIRIEVGPVPAEEACAQVGDPDYVVRSRCETAVYMRQLQRIFGFPPPEQLTFQRQGFSHDLGRYYEVVACMNRRGESRFDESKLPSTWDHIARAELTWTLLSRRYREECWTGMRAPDEVPPLYLGAVPDFPDHPVAYWMALGWTPTAAAPALAYH